MLTASVRSFVRLSVCLSLSVGTGVAVAADESLSVDPLDQLVVSATRAPGGVARELLGASVTTLEPEDLRDRQVRSLADVLRDVPGIAVSRAGPPGSVTQLRLRGTEANHALVLIDGMQATDPFFGEFDFAGLMADMVARVEVLRGQQSALYGSDAIGGVIQYLTLGGREAPGFSARAEGGSFGTYDTAARLAGVSGPVDYAVSGGVMHSDGSPSARLGVRDIGADNQVVSGRLRWDFSDTLRLRAVARYTRARADFNQQDFDYTSPTYGFVIDSTDRSDTRMLQGMLTAERDGLEGRWQQSLSLQGADAQRDSFSFGARDSGNTGSRLKASYVSSLRVDSARLAQQLVFAADLQREHFQNTGPYASPAQGEAHHLDNLGLVAQYNLVVDEHIGLAAALRHDRNQRFLNADTYRLQASYRLDGGTRLHAAAGSGIKNPAPTEIFGYDPQTFVGNANLKPEQSQGWEMGVEQSLWDKRLLLGATWADSRLHDEIYTVYSGPDFVASPANRLQTSRQQSAEFFAQARLVNGLQVDASYTWLDAREDGQAEVRRPPQVGSLNLVWSTPARGVSLHAGLRYNGATDDYNFTAVGPPRVSLKAYTLVQLGGELRVTPGLQVFGRVENLLGERYEDVYTYRTQGRGFFVGLRTAR